MSRFNNRSIIFGALFLIIAVSYSAFADTDNHDDNKHKKHDRKHLNSVINPTYKEQCGSCHFAYQSGLLPSGSWEKIIAGLDDHFGETVEFDSETKKIITEYLINNAANYSSGKRSVKIMKSLGTQTPLRITDIPYIIKKHDDIAADVYNRKSIGSFSNCASCHKTAENGVYDDDNANIPR